MLRLCVPTRRHVRVLFILIPSRSAVRHERSTLLQGISNSNSVLLTFMAFPIALQPSMPNPFQATFRIRRPVFFYNHKASLRKVELTDFWHISANKKKKTATKFFTSCAVYVLIKVAPGEAKMTFERCKPGPIDYFCELFAYLRTTLWAPMHTFRASQMATAPFLRMWFQLTSRISRVWFSTT